MVKPFLVCAVVNACRTRLISLASYPESFRFGKILLMLPEPGENSLNALRPGEPGDDLATAEQHKVRYAPYAEPSRKGRVLLGIDLDDGCLSRQFFRYCSHRRRE